MMYVCADYSFCVCSAHECVHGFGSVCAYACACVFLCMYTYIRTNHIRMHTHHGAHTYISTQKHFPRDCVYCVLEQQNPVLARRRLPFFDTEAMKYAQVQVRDRHEEGQGRNRHLAALPKDCPLRKLEAYDVSSSGIVGARWNWE
jgi:hypothetical protein